MVAEKSYFEGSEVYQIRDRALYGLNKVVTSRYRERLFSFVGSFVTANQTTHKFVAPCALRVTLIHASVLTALGASDAGTITPKDADGNTMTGGTISLAASAAVATEATSRPYANNTFDKGDDIQFVLAKTTTNGVVRVEVFYEPMVDFGAEPENLERMGILDEISFVTASQTTHAFFFPVGATVRRIEYFVTSALGAVEVGTVTPKDNAGNTIVGTLANSSGTTVSGITLSSAVAARFTFTPVIPIVFTAGQKLQIYATKATTGGQCRAIIYYDIGDPAVETYTLDGISFASGEVGAFFVHMPVDGTIEKLRGQVSVTAIGASNDGSATLKHADYDTAPSVTTGAVTFTAADAVGTIETAASPTGLQWFGRRVRMQITTAKSTENGGRCRLQVEYRPDKTPGLVVLNGSVYDWQSIPSS